VAKLLLISVDHKRLKRSRAAALEPFWHYLEARVSVRNSSTEPKDNEEVGEGKKRLSRPVQPVYICQLRPVQHLGGDCCGNTSANESEKKFEAEEAQLRGLGLWLTLHAAMSVGNGVLYQESFGNSSRGFPLTYQVVEKGKVREERRGEKPTRYVVTG
jgi:hypothetical protein